MRTIVVVAAIAGIVGCAEIRRDAASQDPAALQKQRDDLHRTMQEERRQRDYEDWMRWVG
jgi:hypothetical protein